MRELLFLAILFLSGANAYASVHKALLVDNPLDSLMLRFDLINEAKEEILVSYFEFKDDTDGILFLHLLERAAERGVRVRILVDDFGKDIRSSRLSNLLDAGDVSFLVYNRINPFKLYANTYRMHDKILLIDGKYLVTGGRNVKNTYHGRKNDPRPVLTDKEILSVLFNLASGVGAIDLIRFAYSRANYNFNYRREIVDRDVLIVGPAVQRARRYFAQRWDSKRADHPVMGAFAFSKGDDIAKEKYLVCRAKAQSFEERHQCMLKKIRTNANNLYKSCIKQNDVTMDFCRRSKRKRYAGAKRAFEKNLLKAELHLGRDEFSGNHDFTLWENRLKPVEDIQWMHFLTDNTDLELASINDLHIADTYHQLIAESEESVWMSAPYLLPTRELWKVLEHSVSREYPLQELKLMTNSASTADSLLTFGAYTKVRKKLASLPNTELYEFANKDLNHSKSAVFDYDLSFVGSFNLDPRSQNLNTESGVLIRSEEFNAELRESMQRQMDESYRVLEQGKSSKEIESNRRVPFYRWLDIGIMGTISRLVPIIDTQL